MCFNVWLSGLLTGPVLLLGPRGALTFGLCSAAVATASVIHHQ